MPRSRTDRLGRYEFLAPAGAEDSAPEHCMICLREEFRFLRTRISRAYRAAWRRTAMVAAAALIAVAPAPAHPSFTMFDMTKRITLVGTVTAFEWSNPHAYIEIDAQGEAGE